VPRNRPRDDDDDDDYDDAPRPRRPKRRRRSNSTPWIVGGVLGTLALVGIVVLVVTLNKRNDGPGSGGGRTVKLGNKEFPEEMLINDAITFGSKLDVPANWTHQDLANYLNTKGLSVTIQHDPSLGSANGQGVWFVDARPPANPNETRVKRGRIRVYHCPSQRDAARQVVAMRSELYLPYVVGHFAVGIDGHQEPPDEDVFFDMNVKGHLR
jgi:hypothetical protein